MKYLFPTNRKTFKNKMKITQTRTSRFQIKKKLNVYDGSFRSYPDQLGPLNPEVQRGEGERINQTISMPTVKVAVMDGTETPSCRTR